MDDRDLYAGLIRLHILHHAAHEPIFGLGIIEELARHSYKLSAGLGRSRELTRQCSRERTRVA
jgi:hypothetical protein